MLITFLKIIEPRFFSLGFFVYICIVIKVKPIMTHKEFKLTIKKEITEQAGFAENIVMYKVGDTLQVDETTFNLLLSGESVKRHTRYGYMVFDKYNFENEVAVTSITVEYGIRKLGQRKSKKVEK